MYLSIWIVAITAAACLNRQTIGGLIRDLDRARADIRRLETRLDLMPKPFKPRGDLTVHPEPSEFSAWKPGSLRLVADADQLLGGECDSHVTN